MHACFRKAAELAADWTEGRDLQRLWPELSAEQLDKASQVCLGFAHSDVIARLPAVDKRARAWGALHTLLLRKPKLYDADEPAELQVFGAGAVDDQLRVLQAGARVFWLLDSAKGHFDVGKVETASACAKQAVSVARAELGHADVAQYFDTNILDHAAKQNGNYEYVRDKVSASLIDFHANMCAQPVVLPTLSVPLPNVYAARPMEALQAEVAHLRRALLTEKTLRAGVEQENRQLRKANFREQQQRRLGLWATLCCHARCVWEYLQSVVQRAKAAVSDLINVEDVDAPDNPELVEPSKKTY